MLQINVTEIKTHIFCSKKLLFRKYCLLEDKVVKYRTAGKATDDNIAQANYILDT